MNKISLGFVVMLLGIGATGCGTLEYSESHKLYIGPTRSAVTNVVLIVSTQVVAAVSQSTLIVDDPTGTHIYGGCDSCDSIVIVWEPLENDKPAQRVASPASKPAVAPPASPAPPKVDPQAKVESDRTATSSSRIVVINSGPPRGVPPPAEFDMSWGGWVSRPRIVRQRVFVGRTVSGSCLMNYHPGGWYSSYTGFTPDPPPVVAFRGGGRHHR